MAVEHMREAALTGDGRAFGRADVAFHRAFQEVTGQRRILSMWRRFERSLEALLEVNPHPRDDLPRAVDTHAGLLEAVESGDPDWESLLLRHLTDARERFAPKYPSGEAEEVKMNETRMN